MDLSAMKVLIIDHMPAFRDIMKKTLKKDGYNIFTAGKGDKALKKLKDLMPDLILMEVDLPEMSGFEICKAIKKDKGISHIPVIFVTERDDRDDMEEGFEAGCVDYIIKPFQKIDLSSRVKNHLHNVSLRKTIEKQALLKGVLEMAGATAHELNQPLSVILMNAELLTMTAGEGNPCLKRIKRIESNAQKMSEIIKRITHITQYETRDYFGETKIIDIKKASSKLLIE